MLSWPPSVRVFVATQPVDGLLVADAYDRGLYSEGQVAQMLGLDRLKARELLDEVRQVVLMVARTRGFLDMAAPI